MADISVQGESIETDPVSSFSFDGIHEKAMAAWGDTPEPAAEPLEEQVAPEATPEPIAEPEASAENIDGASASQLAQLKDTDLVEVTVD